MASLKTHLSSIANTFNVLRTNPVLIIQVQPTPYEFKTLSYIDEPIKEGQNLARVIRDALALSNNVFLCRALFY